jgi:hypothetical protein
MANLRLKPHYSVIAHSPDVVELRHGVWNATSFTLTDESGRGDLYRLICRLDGSARPSAIAKEEGVPRSDVEALVDHLVSLDVVEEGPSSGVDYYLDELLPRPAATNGDMPAGPHAARARVLGDPELVAELVRCRRARCPR